MPARVHRLPCEREVAAKPPEGFRPAAKLPQRSSVLKPHIQRTSSTKRASASTTRSLPINAIRRKEFTPPRCPSIPKQHPSTKRASASSTPCFPQKASTAGAHCLPCEREVAAQPPEGFHPTAKPPHRPSILKQQAASINKAGKYLSAYPLPKNAVRRKDSPAASPRQPEVFSLHPVTKRASASSTRPLPPKASPAGAQCLPCEREVAAQPPEGFHPAVKPPHRPSIPKQHPSTKRAGAEEPTCFP